MGLIFYSGKKHWADKLIVKPSTLKSSYKEIEGLKKASTEIDNLFEKIF